MNFAEWASSECKKIRADGMRLQENREALASRGRRLRFDGCIRNDGPVFGGSEFQLKAAFEIGLIETGERHVSVHRDKEGVQILGIVVFVFETGDGFTRGSDGCGEIHAHGIVAGADSAGGELDVAVFDF